jgi:hypothetical protein
MTDALVAEAVREDSVAGLRRLFKPRDLVIMAASTGLFAWAVATDGHWIWWLAGLPLVLLVLIGGIWLASYFVLPGRAVSRLRHLPHRNVAIHLSAPEITFETATEQLKVVWGEVREIKRHEQFWVICLKAGAQIPVPVASLGASARSVFDDKFAIARPRR